MWETPPWAPLEVRAREQRWGVGEVGVASTQNWVMQSLDNSVIVYPDVILRDGVREVKDSMSYVNRGLSRFLSGSWFWLCIARMCSPSCLMLWFRAVFSPLGGCEDFDMGNFSRYLIFYIFSLCLWKNKSLLLVLKPIWILKQLVSYFLSSSRLCLTNATLAYHGLPMDWG